jgi:predicted membrane chloride channel (bestrophin family)
MTTEQKEFIRLAEHFIKKTGLDVRQNTRKREIVELKAAFCFIIRKRFRRRVTLTKMGQFLSRNHASVVYLQKNYEQVICRYNAELSKIVEDVLNNENFFNDDNIRQTYRSVGNPSQSNNAAI